MKGLGGILTGFLLLAATIVAVAAAAGQMPNDEASVRATVETYLHGLKFNDVESFKRAFNPEAKLFFVRKNGELGQLTQEQWYKGFAASAGKEEHGELRIAAVDITGKAASVKVIETYPDSTYTDYVSLLKLSNEWKIVNKVFTFEKRAS